MVVTAFGVSHPFDLNVSEISVAASEVLGLPETLLRRDIRIVGMGYESMGSMIWNRDAY